MRRRGLCAVLPHPVRVVAGVGVAGVGVAGVGVGGVVVGVVVAAAGAAALTDGIQTKKEGILCIRVDSSR
jgi:hypothetical protein